MASMSERLGMVKIFEAFPKELEKAIGGLSDEQLDSPYAEGKWTIRQVVHHLADAHLNGYMRVRLIITEDNPTLKTYDQDAWAQLCDARDEPIESSLDILRGVHHRMATLLAAAPEESWRRVAHHPKVGDMTLDLLLPVYVRHCETHLKQILDFKERLSL